jgi:hypothetical protein
MKPQILLVLGILAVLLVSGCSQTGQVIDTTLECKPDYIVASYDPLLVPNSNVTESCKALCYKQFQTTSFKIADQDNPNMASVIPFKCSCDINKCGQYVDDRAIAKLKDDEYCSQANAIVIRSGIYDSGKLILEIFNNGHVPLTLRSRLDYKNGEIVNYPSTFSIKPDNTKTFTTGIFNITGVKPNLQRVSVWSEECPKAGDFFYDYSNIVGLGK